MSLDSISLYITNKVFKLIIPPRLICKVREGHLQGRAGEVIGGPQKSGHAISQQHNKTTYISNPKWHLNNPQK
jgi:hypothetical protein